jgi:UDP-3-O-[3-hydroxymyristoyl] glucosamine N-acyltransferase
MADPRFFDKAGPFSLTQLADLTDAEIARGADGGVMFSDVSPLGEACQSDVSFLDNKKYVEAFACSKAGVCVIAPAMAERAPSGMALLLSPDPYRAYAKIAQAFYPAPTYPAGVHPRAIVDPSAKLGVGCHIGPGAVIEAKAEIGARSVILANAVIGQGVVIGDETVIGATASLSHCLIGRRVIIHPGVRIGQDGFGFAMGQQGHLKVPQLGRVVVEDDVEIGANTTIDRGAGPDTIIKAGTKIDNLVQIAHNVVLGKACIIVAQVGISGSTEFGDFAIAAGQAGITGHLKIGTGARIAAQSGVMRDIEPGVKVGGSPAVPIMDYHRQTTILSRLASKKEK